LKQNNFIILKYIIVLLLSFSIFSCKLRIIEYKYPTTNEKYEEANKESTVQKNIEVEETRNKNVIKSQNDNEIEFNINESSNNDEIMIETELRNLYLENENKIQDEIVIIGEPECKKNTKISVPYWFKNLQYQLGACICAPDSKTIEIDYGQSLIAESDYKDLTENFQVYYAVNSVLIESNECKIVLGFCGGSGSEIPKNLKVIPSRVRINPELSEILGKYVITIEGKDEELKHYKGVVQDKPDDQFAIKKITELELDINELVTKLRDGTIGSVALDVLKDFLNMYSQ